ncbi:Hypothetical predicted protein, partial [Pelobates cultripes]
LEINDFRKIQIDLAEIHHEVVAAEILLYCACNVIIVPRKSTASFCSLANKELKLQSLD